MTAAADSVFISYAGPDRAWAEWAAWHLQHAGHRVVLDVWDWRTGDDFTERMTEAMGRATVVVALFSKHYFERSRWTHEEWTSVVARRGRLIPLAVEPLDGTDIPAILAPIIRKDLHGLDEHAAITALLDAIRPRGPLTKPVFPGTPALAYPTALTAATGQRPPLPRSVDPSDLENFRDHNLNPTSIEADPNRQFDAFLCHNSRDKTEVRNLAKNLRKLNINPWFDEEQLPPGRPWQDLLEDQIDQVRSAVICVGESGRGPWQDMELRGFMMAFAERGCPVIPVILPGATGVPSLPTFLRAFTFVDFRVSEPDPLRRLIWGITGARLED